jgi:outer membrane protein TolC
MRIVLYEEEYKMSYRNVISKSYGMLLLSLSRVRAVLLFAFFVLLSATDPSMCTGEETGAGQGEVVLSLRKSVELMLSNNLDLKVERYNPYLMEKEVIKEKAVFDPLARFSLQDSKMVVSPTTLLNGVLRNESYEQEKIDYEASLAMKLMTGGLGEIKFSTNKYETNSIFQYDSPTYFSNIVFSLNQPLLRNFGVDLNKSRITISSNNVAISRTRLGDATTNMITNLQQVYWNLYLAQQVLDVKNDSLQLARDLMERNKSLVELGTLPSIEILRAEAGVASREEDVIVAENAVRDLEDLLKENLNLPLQDQAIVLSDKPVLKEFQQREVKDYLTIARENRADYQEAQMHIENLKITHKVAKNAMLPLFDIQASYGINATKGHYDTSVKGLDAGGDYSWLVGFKMEIPLGNRWAKNNYQQSKVELEKAETVLKSMERKIELEIKEALRGITSNHKRIRVTQESRRLSQKNLEAEEERMELGMSTSMDVLAVQAERAAAQTRESKAIVDYITSLDHLDRVLGTLLETYQIEVKERTEVSHAIQEVRSWQ